ncbi:MAG: hypothetical protein L0332_03935 [Chloroflexi bacterium]|nr:hypothetical protein [Chloroflexota bacterium]MCI0578929.1 hypothetical protein [Chloroflexota bacterium]MCI0646866.1 hypothetical protein [Chloroflexota bacterium]MCI0725859.1 hypothetical protein [Chloroflexota bacterium]
MSKQWLALVLLLLAYAAGCQAGAGRLTGSTDDEATSPGPVEPAGTPQAVELTELAEDPAGFENTYLQVTGQLNYAPLVVCSSKPRLSPAIWVLADGELSIPAASQSNTVRQVAPLQLTLTVAGRWQRWRGPVGCGRNAPEIEIWYLNVERILAPNPIALVTVIPGEGNEAATPGLPSTGESPPGEGDIPAPGTPGGGGGPAGQATLPAYPGPGTPPGGPAPGGTPVSGPQASPPVGSATAGPGNPTAAPPTTPAPPPTPGTAGQTPTSSSGVTPSPTSQSGASATPAPTGGATQPPTVEDQGPIEINSLETATLAGNGSHRWTLTITETTVITISVASEIEVDASITVLDPAGNTVARQNNARLGSPEILIGVALPTPGDYEVLIGEATGVTGMYSILILDSNAYSFVFQGTVAYGTLASATLQPENDHFWHFAGTAGEEIVITVIPSDNSDLFLRLFSVDESLIEEFYDENGAGEEEVLVLTLPQTGLYSLLVGEVNFGQASYQVLVDLE